MFQLTLLYNRFNVEPQIEPPPQYVAYPRDFAKPYGTVEQFEALGDGYFGLNFGFLCMIASALLLFGISNWYPPVGGLVFLVYPVVAVVATLPYNKKIAYGKGWPVWSGLVASICIGLSTYVCGGLVACIVMQQIASNEMKKYGLKQGFTFTKKRFRYYVEQRREMDARTLEPFNMNGPA